MGIRGYSLIYYKSKLGALAKWKPACRQAGAEVQKTNHVFCLYNKK